MRAPGTNPDGTLNKPAVIGTLVSATPSAVTVQLQDNSQKTFTVSDATQVISQVANGQTGKTLSDLTAGTMILVVPDATGAAAAQVSVVPMAPPPPTNGAPASVSGTVASKSATTLVIKPQDGSANMSVTINNTTEVLSNVLAGQPGKTMSDVVAGTMVTVSGTAGATGIKANSVQILSAVGQ